MNHRASRAGHKDWHVERQEQVDLFFQQRLERLLESRGTFANASEIARAHPGAELAFSELKGHPVIKLSDQALRSIWPTVSEWHYASFLAQIRFSRIDAWPKIVSKLMQSEGIECEGDDDPRAPGGRPKKAESTREFMKMGEMVENAIPQFEKLRTQYDALRRKFPARAEYWKNELQRAGALLNQIDALLQSKTARSAAIHYVAMKLSVKAKTVQNHYSTYKKARGKTG